MLSGWAEGGGRKPPYWQVNISWSKTCVPLPALFCQKILHIRRQSPDHMHSQIKAIGFYEFVGRYIVEVLGRGNLSGNLSRKVHSICPKEFQKTMQLVRHQERVYRVTKENDFCLGQSFPRVEKSFS